MSSFHHLDLYGKLSPVVAKTADLLASLDEFETGYGFLLDDLEQQVCNVLPTLADGYNRYYYGDKAEAYREVRSTISRVQSHLLLLNELGVFNNAPVYDLCTEYESRITHLNGLIRKMEENERGGGSDG